MVSRGTLQIFDQYQKSRLTFVQAVAELALRPQNTEILCKAGIIGEKLYKSSFLSLLVFIKYIEFKMNVG